MSDGGNVELAEIDGLVVRLRLQGACGSCPSSTVTMKVRALPPCLCVCVCAGGLELTAGRMRPVPLLR